MTIDEAILEFKERAEDSRNMSKLGLKNYIPKEKEEKQVAEWLEELKELRNMTAGHLYAVAFNMGYLKAEKEARNKAIDDFKSRLEERILAGKMIDEKFAYIDNCDIDEIAEQLKEGE